MKERGFAIGTYMFGFVVLWVVLIFLGTFMRGPGWYFFWPGQYWDPHKTVALTNVPRIRDVDTMIDLLGDLGADAAWTGPNEERGPP